MDNEVQANLKVFAEEASWSLNHDKDWPSIWKNSKWRAHAKTNSWKMKNIEQVKNLKDHNSSG